MVDGVKSADESVTSPMDDPDNSWDALFGLWYFDRVVVDSLEEGRSAGASAELNTLSEHSMETIDESALAFADGCFIKHLSCPIAETGYRIKISGDANQRQVQLHIKFSAWFLLFRVIYFYFNSTFGLTCFVL